MAACPDLFHSSTLMGWTWRSLKQSKTVWSSSNQLTTALTSGSEKRNPIWCVGLVFASCSMSLANLSLKPRGRHAARHLGQNLFTHVVTAVSSVMLRIFKSRRVAFCLVNCCEPAKSWIRTCFPLDGFCIPSWISFTVVHSSTVKKPILVPLIIRTLSFHVVISSILHVRLFFTSGLDGCMHLLLIGGRSEDAFFRTWGFSF